MLASTSLVARASVWYAVCSVLQKCIGLIVIPIYTRLMSGDDYGTYVVFQSWTEIAAIFITLNLGSYVFNNGMMKYENDRDGFTSSMLGLTGLIGILWLLIFLIAPEFWSAVLGMSAPYVFLLVLRCIVMPCYSYWSARLRYEFKYKPVVALTLCLTILTPAVSIPLIFFSQDKLSSALVCQVLVMALVYLVPLVSIVSKSRKFISLEYWIFALKFNLPLIPHLLSTIILQQCDRIMIQSLCGAFSSALYSVACSAGLAMSFIHNSVVQSLTPWMYQMMKGKRYGDIQPVGLSLMFLISLASLILSLFAPEIMALLAPPEYLEGMYAIPPVAACVMLMTLFNLFVTVEYYYEQTKLVMIASAIAAIANVFLNWLLLPIFDYIAAAYTTLLCYFILSVGHYFLMKLALKRNKCESGIFEGKTIFGAAIALVTLVLSSVLIYPYPIARYFAILVMAMAGLINREKLIGLFFRFRDSGSRQK